MGHVGAEEKFLVVVGDDGGGVDGVDGVDNGGGDDGGNDGDVGCDVVFFVFFVVGADVNLFLSIEYQPFDPSCDA